MKYRTQAAQAAAQIREILKKNFPATKFSIKSDTYSMGDSVCINWTDGAAEDKVKKLVSHYQYGNFNVMEHIYEYTNCRDDIPQTKYLFLNRGISNEVYLEKLEELRIKWDILTNIKAEDIHKTNQEILDKTGHWTTAGFIYQKFDGFKKIDLTKPKPISIKEELEEEKTLNTLIDAGKLGCKLVEYSEKAIALFGNTKPLKDKLKKLGGRFNPFLNNDGEKQGGWIFQKSKKQELINLIN